MAEKDEIVTFTTEDGDTAEFRVIEQTKFNGVNYLLVLDDFEDEEEEALIMKEVKNENDELTYEIVDSDQEIEAVAGIFEELLSDTELVLNK